MKKTISIILISSLLSSCTIFSPSNFIAPPRDTYELSPVRIESLATKTNARILVRLPLALTAIDSNRLVSRSDGGKVTWLANVQWSDPLPQMIQVRFIEMFENSRAFKAVLRPGDGISSSHHLLTDIRKFEITQGEVQLELSVKLFSRKQGEIVAADIFTANIATRLSTKARLESFNQAFSMLGNQILIWLIENSN